MSIVFKKVFVICLVVILTTLMSPQIHAATIVVNADFLSFPDVCPEYSVAENITLTNTSEDPVTLSIWIQDNTWNQFSIISPNPLPDSLEGNGQVTLEIEFTPPYDTMFSSLLNVKVNDNDNDIAWVSLYGSGYCPMCTEPEELCSGACVNTSNDPTNCGACDYACSEYATCTGGICQLDCGELNACDDTCVDLLSDPNNCGVCGNICSEYATCTGGICQLDCGELTACGETCVDFSVDPNNCGTCGNTCPGADTGMASCELGICGFSACPPNTIDLTHCGDFGRRICAVDIYHYANSEGFAGNLNPRGVRPADLNRFNHFFDSLDRLRGDLLDCRIAAGCATLQTLYAQVDGVNPESCGGSDECGGGGVPDAVDGPSLGSLSSYIYDQISLTCWALRP